MPKKIKKIPIKTENKSPVAMLFKDPRIEKQLDFIKGAAEIGIKKAGRGVVLIYRRTSKIGEIAKDLFFLFLGISIFLTGIFATPADLLSIVRLANELSKGLFGRFIIAIIGLGLLSYAVGRIISWIKREFVEIAKK